MRAPLIFIALAASIVLGVQKFWNERTQSHPPGILVPDIPVQKELTETTQFMRFDHRIVARADRAGHRALALSL